MVDIVGSDGAKAAPLLTAETLRADCTEECSLPLPLRFGE
jgi:hypothetical protein